MTKLFLAVIIVATLMTATCGDSTKSDPVPMAKGIPNHIAGEAVADETIEAEAGDRVTIRLSESKGDQSWQLISSGDIAVIDNKDGYIKTDDMGRARFFYFQTQMIGTHQISFSKSGAKNLTFTVNVR